MCAIGNTQFESFCFSLMFISKAEQHTHIQREKEGCSVHWFIPLRAATATFGPVAETQTPKLSPPAFPGTLAESWMRNQIAGLEFEAALQYGMWALQTVA